MVMVAAAVHHSRVGSNIMYCNVRQAKSRKLLECLFVVLYVRYVRVITTWYGGR